MKKIAAATMILGVSTLLWTTNVLAEGIGWRGGDGWGAGGHYGRLYDAKTVETIAGEVTAVEQMTPRDMGPGVHLTLKTDKETVSVHLGPAWYIERQETRLAAGDKVEIKGSRITFQDKPAVIAAEVHKGDEVLMLRDASGFPMWAGWRRRNP